MSELQCVKFGDMAQQITTKVKPKDTTLDTYVGLEHLDTGSLQIKRRGTPQDVIGEKLRVCKGDIILGKRRVYQRKVAIADFDGICSAHAMVLRPKEDVVNKDFFPFFMQSDQFMERALQISVGSLSPTINWKTLADQEFTIPSLPDQRRIAATFCAAEDCIVKGERFHTVAERAKQVLLKEIFERSLNGGLKNWEKTSLSKCIVERSAGSQPPHKKIKYVGLEHFESGNHHLVSYGDSEKFGSNCSVFEKGDILYSKLRPYLDKAAIADFDGVCTTEVIDLNANEKTTNKFLINLLHSKKFVEWTTHRSYGTKMPRTSIDLIGKYNFLLPPLPEQRQIAGILTRCDETTAAARANVAAAKALKMKMINEMLGHEKPNNY